MPQHKSRPDSLFETADTTQDPRQNRRGTLRFPPQLEMRPSSIAPTPEESREAPHNSKGFLTSHRHHEKLPEVTVTTRGNPKFPATNRETPWDSPFNVNWGPILLPWLKSNPTLPPQLEWGLEFPGATREASWSPHHNSRETPNFHHKSRKSTRFPRHCQMRLFFSSRA